MTIIPNPPSAGDEFTNELTGVTYRYDGEKWLAVSAPGNEALDTLTERVANGETKQSEIEGTIADALVVQANKVDKTGDTMTGRLTAPRIAVDSTTLESGRVFEAKFQGETNAWINANGQVRSNFVLDDDSEFKTLTTKQYVDDKVGGAGYLPLTGGTLTGTTRITGASFFVNNADGDEVIRLQETGFVRSLDMFRCQRETDGPAFQARIGTEANAEIRTNGSAFFKGTVNMHNNKVINVLTPSSDNDAANKSYVDTTVTGFATETYVDDALSPYALETYVDDAITADASHVQVAGGTMTGELKIDRPSAYNHLLIKNSGTNAFKVGNFNDEARLTVYNGQIFKVVGYVDDTLTQLFGVSDTGRVTVNNVRTPTNARDAATKEYVDNLLAAPARLSWKWDSTSSGHTAPPTGAFKYTATGSDHYYRFSFETYNGIKLGESVINDFNRAIENGPVGTIWYKEANGWKFKQQFRINTFRWNYENHFEFRVTSRNGSTSFTPGTPYYITIGGFF